MHFDFFWFTYIQTDRQTDRQTDGTGTHTHKQHATSYEFKWCMCVCVCVRDACVCVCVCMCVWCMLSRLCHLLNTFLPAACKTLNFCKSRSFIMPKAMKPMKAMKAVKKAAPKAMKTVKQAAPKRDQSKALRYIKFRFETLLFCMNWRNPKVVTETQSKQISFWIYWSENKKHRKVVTETLKKQNYFWMVGPKYITKSDPK